MDGLDVRSRRSSRNVEPSPLTPRPSARGGGADEDGLSLAQLAAGVAGLSSQVDRVAQQCGEDTRATLDSVEQMSKSLAATVDSRKVSVAEARRRAGMAGGARADDVSAVNLEAAARAMVDEWLGPRKLAQYADRIVFAFKEAQYRPHEWSHTLDSMGPDELREFIAAVEKSPAPNEGETDTGRARRRSRGGGSAPGPGTASDGLSGTLAEVARISGPKAGRRAGGGSRSEGGRPPSDDAAGTELKSRKVGRRGQSMEAVPRAAAGQERGARAVPSVGTRPGPRAGRRAAAEAATAAANRGRRAAAMAGPAR